LSVIGHGAVEEELPELLRVSSRNAVRDLQSATVAGELQILRSPGLLQDDTTGESGAM
jgi:hypothetical protein